MKTASILIIISFLITAHHHAVAQGFTNMSADYGLDYSFGPVDYGGGVSFADFNQDGLDDLTFTSGFGSPMYFHQNTGSGFVQLDALVANTTETKQPLWVDYDNDGDLDLWITSYQLNRLYRNDGDLTLTDVTATCGFSDPVAVSFNGSWLDYDEDGYLDLVTAHRFQYLVGELTLYHNLGNGTFEDATVDAGLGNGIGNSVLAMATLDFNNDGWEDIFVGQDYQAGCLLLKNMGDGTFANISAGSGANIMNNTMTATIGDYNNDGFMDIFITDTGGDGCSLLQNQGDETFVDVALAQGVILNHFTWGASFFDADNDMDLDLHVDERSGSPFASRMFENISGENFIVSNNAWGMGADVDESIGNAVGDYNNDGYPDLVKNNTDGSPNGFWRNDFDENNYLSIKLQGSVSNSMAVGSVLHVYAGGVHQMRRVGCGEGFCSQHSYTQFFGLGTNEVVDSLLVIWPGYLQTKLYDVDGNQLLTLIEDTALGCMDVTACNYDPDATINGGNCLYQTSYSDCNGICFNDDDGDGVCNEIEMPGCTDFFACNYSYQATDDDATCEYTTCAGCTDPLADNYIPGSTIDDGSCTYSCIPSTLTILTDCWGEETSWELLDPEGNILNSVNNMPDNTFTYTWAMCLSEGCSYTFNIYDSYGDGLAGTGTGCNIDGNYFMEDNLGNILFEMEAPDFDFGTSHTFCIGIAGCMDETACNFISTATVDDGTCIFPQPYFDCDGNCVNDTDGDDVCDELEIIGCTDADACNFDSTATEEDHSCTYVPTYSIDGSTTAIELEEYTYTYSETAGSTYEWIITNGTIISGQGTASVVVVWDEGETEGWLAITETNAESCQGDESGIVVSISPIGIDETGAVDFSVYPNPVNDFLFVKYNSVTTGTIYFRLMDCNGKTLCGGIETHPEFMLNLEHFASGVYVLKLQSDFGFSWTKVVIE